MQGNLSSDYLASRCAGLLSHLSIPSTDVWTSELIPANTNILFPENSPDCELPSAQVDVELCRVTMRVVTSTSPPGEVSLEAWLPTDWNGRLLEIANGGLGGCIFYHDLAYGASQGFATIGTNGGKNGTSGLPFLQNEAVLEDFAYRSIHTGAVVGKQVTASFYGRSHTTAYMMGCSTGGRQAFKEAQDFPEDFDGILAGAPAISMNSLASWCASFYTHTGPPGSPTFLSPAQWDLVMNDVLRQCDALDGIVDGFIEDPDLCSYRPENLLCSKSDPSKDCLTSAQVGTVNAFFSDLYGSDGRLIYPRLQPGADPHPYGSGSPYDISVDWFRYVVYNNTEWEPIFGLADYEAAIALNPFNVQTWEGDLSGAKEAGTRILHYHGLTDDVISSEISQRYYNYVSRTMGLTSDELDEFYRYFRISGLHHCRGGDGAARIGNYLVNSDGFEPENNVLWALVKWVEEGIGPEHVRGSGVREDNSTVVRHHCKYPLRNMYVGEGDPDKPESWKCV
ncbi:tannase and feruloyl esterase [Stachybotrys elegans]|uniref:Carboxylic ester hydrolase n=1 Tax=Stachybotrys elegans TaxID=80388 RepID=A0A8K0SWS9_9HYPO|nr:tannase and feruloyl esterase [Stachybotrys elegans]